QGALTILGQDAAASDTLNFNDQGSAAPGTYVLTATTFLRTTPATALVTYDVVAAVNLNAGNLGNTINVQSTAAGTTYTVNTGTGADTVNVGDTSNTLF